MYIGVVDEAHAQAGNGDQPQTDDVRLCVGQECRGERGITDELNGSVDGQHHQGSAGHQGEGSHQRLFLRQARKAINDSHGALRPAGLH